MGAKRKKESGGYKVMIWLHEGGRDSFEYITSERPFAVVGAICVSDPDGKKGVDIWYPWHKVSRVEVEPR